MSCAACQARVEKAVSKVPGVTSCSVSLLTNSMGVEGTASSAEIIKAVKAAGYGASIKKDKGRATQSGADSADEDLLRIRRRRLWSKGWWLRLYFCFRSCIFQWVT